MSDNKKIRSISEGYFHSVQASNKAEKFKLSRLSQGIESCRQAQFRNYRKEEKDLLDTLLKLTKQRISKLPESEDDVLSFVNGEFDGYPQSNAGKRYTITGPTLKVCVPKDDEESPFEIIPSSCQECIDEESEDIPLQRNQSELNASLQVKGSSSAKRGSNAFGSMRTKSQNETKVLQGRKGSLLQGKSGSLFRIESGATGHRVMLARGQRRRSSSSKTDLLTSRVSNEYSETHLSETSNGASPSNASVKYSKHNLSSKSKHKSDLLPQELKARRYSVQDLEETVPFYLMRKYNHYHTNESPEEYFFNRFINRRNALNVLQQGDIDAIRTESQRSADLGTVTLKHPVESKSFNNIQSWDDLKRRCSALCDFSEIRCNVRRRSCAEDRSSAPHLSSPVPPHGADSQEHDVRITTHKNESLGEQQEKHAVTGPFLVTHQRGRSNSLPSSLLLQSFQKSKLWQVNQGQELGRLGRRGSLPSNLRKKRTMPDLSQIKSLKDIDNATGLVDFDDAHVIFPAHNPENPTNFTLRDYRALRKCRYLRLSRLNWESLQWQAQQEALFD